MLACVLSICPAAENLVPTLLHISDIHFGWPYTEKVGEAVQSATLRNGQRINNFAPHENISTGCRKFRRWWYLAITTFPFTAFTNACFAPTATTANTFASNSTPRFASKGQRSWV